MVICPYCRLVIIDHMTNLFQIGLSLSLKKEICRNFQTLGIYVQANFSSKRVCRCLHIHKASERKINEVNKVSKLCFGAPEMFSASQNYLSVSHPPKSGGYGAFILQFPSLYTQVLYSKFSSKLSKFSFLNYTNYNLCCKKVTSKRHSFAYYH